MSNILKDFTGDLIPKKKIKHKKTPSELGKMIIEKGKRGERNCCNILKPITNLFWMKTPGSGSYVGASNRRRIIEMSKGQVNAMLGDVIPPDELIYRFIIESKFYKNFPFKMLQKGKCPKILNIWINELLYDVVSTILLKDTRQTIPLLYIHINHLGEYVVYNPNHLNSFLQELKMNPLYKCDILNQPPQLNWSLEWFMEDFETFLNINKKILFKQF